MTPATEALVERLEGGPHEWGYRCPVEGTFIVDDAPFHAAAALRSLSDSLEGTDEDLYQAVLVAYRRGAHEWARLNYPKWIDRIARDAADHIGDANQMIPPTDFFAENAKNPPLAGEE